MSEPELRRTLDALYTVLCDRIGAALCDRMTADQYACLQTCVEGGDEAAQLQMLEEALPDYSTVVKVERDRIVAEAPDWWRQPPVRPRHTATSDRRAAVQDDVLKK